MKILILEASTSSAKAMVYNTDTNSFVVRSKTYEADGPDLSMHNAEHIFQQVMSLGRELVSGQDIDIISLVGAWHSVLLCNKNMEPQGYAYSWLNTTPKKMCNQLRMDSEYTYDYFHRTGCMVNAIYPFFKLKWFKEHEHVDLSQYFIMGQSTYITYRMTGKCVITDCLTSGSGLLNTVKKELDNTCLDELGVSTDHFCEVVTYKNTYPLLDSCAKLLGVRAGIPVIPANSDGGCNQVGAGAIREGVMTLSVGTSGAVRFSSKTPRIPSTSGTWLYLSPKAWLSGASTNGCCNCLDWFKKTAFSNDVSYSSIESKITDYQNTPVFLPFLFGERCPGWDDERKGGFNALLPSHTIYDMYLGIQEGILFNLYQCYNELIKVNNIPSKIKLSGGILKSNSWTQMCADIFGKDMITDENEHSSLFGGAVLAMELLGVLRNAEDYDSSPTSIIHPNQSKREMYLEKYERYLQYYNSH